MVDNTDTEREFRRRLYDIREDQTLSLEDTVHAFLQLGCEYLDVENGHLKRVDVDRGEHYVIASAGPVSNIATVGDVHEHATTFCRRTLELNSPLAIGNVDEEGWADDPARHEHGLACYIGTTVRVDGLVFGTLCFVSRKAHSRAFTAAERAFVELMASIIGMQLSSHGYARRLTDHDKLLSVLNRILRHNLRNDVNIMQGYATVLSERLEGEDKHLAEQIERRGEKLVSMGEKARRLETIVRDDADPNAVNVGENIDRVQSRLDTPDEAEVSVTAPPNLFAVSSGYLEIAVHELVQNALLHAGPSTSVEIEAIRDSDNGTAVIRVDDDGPGLSQLEQHILAGREETQLQHGQGVGLWMVYWIVFRSGGEIMVDVSDGTTVELHLQLVEDPSNMAWVRRLFLAMTALW